MDIILTGVGIMLACIGAGAFAGITIDRWIRETERLDANPSSVHGRHAKTEPRRKPAETPLLTWDGGPPTKEPWPTWDDARREYERRQEARTAARTATTANEIAPVVLPEPGTYLPQPGRDSGAGTVTFARLDKPATTGEMAAVTDQFLADMAVQEEQFRLGLAT